MEQTAILDENQRTRVIIRDGGDKDQRYHTDPFVSGILERIIQLSPLEAAIVAGLTKLALRDDHIGELVRCEIAKGEASNAAREFDTMPLDAVQEVFFWNGVISGLELAEHRQT